ncbi:MAG: hypothetical protein Q7R33_06065 [Nitrosarchaeum sp.]|nr:hypothetical protein [Nitrosarchaeum sp.]
MADVTALVTELEGAVTEFKAQYDRYTKESINSAGSRSRKALMVAKKAINKIRKGILEDQKADKAKRKATKTEKVAE